jgi:diguanylate cyclase (GGDEF)-like protein
MRLTKKITLFSGILTSLLIVVLILVGLLSFRHFSIKAATEHTKTAAEIVRVGLTEAMINGVIDKRSNFLSRLAEVENLQSTRVVRGPEVIKQHGPGLDNEQPSDDIEREVISHGQPVFQVVDDGMEPIFRGTIPFIATSQGSPNCLQCHLVAEGTVLGAITITMSLSDMQQNAVLTVGSMTLALGLFAITILFLLFRLTRPLVETASDVQQAVSEALEGNFQERIRVRSKDEIGQIARDLNQLMAFLEKGLRSIRDQVAQLIQCKPSLDTNLLINTMEMVDGLVDAARFKQAIEEDESKLEVYTRLAKVLDDEFQIHHYSLYEVANSKNRLSPIVVDGEIEGRCRWCDPDVLIRSEACRARRTGHTINSIDTPSICNSFRPGDHPDAEHICIPVLQSGGVGSVVQLVALPNEVPRLTAAITLLNVYLREAAPVIEAKRLMDTLRESNMRDPMTGLHNRRFLEEFVDTIVAATSRRKSELSILMLDLDYFKKVNDSHGHDAGDTVIKTMAKIFNSCVRASDLVIRYGGEEFMVILQDTSGEAAFAVAEKIRQTVESTKIQLPGTVLQKTISIGIADFPSDSDTFWQAIKFADVALYQAKERGRNRVIRFAPEMWRDTDDY